MSIRHFLTLRSVNNTLSDTAVASNAGVQVGNYSHELRGLVQELLERNYQKRPCAAEILQRPIVQGEIRRMLLEEQAVQPSPATQRPCFDTADGGRNRSGSLYYGSKTVTGFPSVLFAESVRRPLLLHHCSRRTQ